MEEEELAPYYDRDEDINADSDFEMQREDKFLKEEEND